MDCERVWEFVCGGGGGWGGRGGRGLGCVRRERGLKRGVSTLVGKEEKGKKVK